MCQQGYTRPYIFANLHRIDTLCGGVIVVYPIALETSVSCLQTDL